MSTQEEDQKTVVVQNPPNTGGTVTTVSRDQPATVVRTAPEVPANQHNETIVKHRSTNTGAVVAMVIGLVVLLGGIGLIASQIPFIPWPYDIYVVLGFGLILLLIGASMITNKS
jgi:hypothetical protein